MRTLQYFTILLFASLFIYSCGKDTITGPTNNNTTGNILFSRDTMSIGADSVGFVSLANFTNFVFTDTTIHNIKVEGKLQTDFNGYSGGSCYMNVISNSDTTIWSYVKSNIVAPLDTTLNNIIDISNFNHFNVECNFMVYLNFNLENVHHSIRFKDIKITKVN